MRAPPILVTLSLLFVSTAAMAGSYDETVNGDISGDRANPTFINLGVGSNPISATSMSGDVEYFRVTVPTGFKLSAITVQSYANGNLSFIGVQRGTTFTEPPTGTTVANLLGYSHFGSGNSTIGTDILPLMGTGAGSHQFTPPLLPGDYTFWAQETGGVPVSYTLNFQLATGSSVPATPPFALAALAAGLALVGVRMARRGEPKRTPTT